MGVIDRWLVVWLVSDLPSILHGSVRSGVNSPSLIGFNWHLEGANIITLFPIMVAGYVKGKDASWRYTHFFH